MQADSTHGADWKSVLLCHLGAQVYRLQGYAICQLGLRKTTCTSYAANDRHLAGAKAPISVTSSLVCEWPHGLHMVPDTPSRAPAGFQLSDAAVFVDDVAVQTSSKSDDTIDFEWPPHAAGPAKLHVVRGGLKSNEIRVVYEALPEIKAGEQTQGGPFAAQPVFGQKTIAYKHVRACLQTPRFDLHRSPEVTRLTRSCAPESTKVGS